MIWLSVEDGRRRASLSKRQILPNLDAQRAARRARRDFLPNQVEPVGKQTAGQALLLEARV